jgi:hypothetical protein
VQTSGFGMRVMNTQEEFMMASNSSLYKQRLEEILQEHVLLIRGVRCTPYLISDLPYPIRTFCKKIRRLETL